MITLKEIARLANVSVSTASRALNDDPRISLEQRMRLQQLAEEHNYTKHKNKTQKKESLHASAWKNAGIIVPEINSGYYSQLVDAATLHLARHSYSPLLRLSCFDPQTLLRHIEGFGAMDVACLLIVIDDAEHMTEDIYQAIHNTGLPAMLVTSQYHSHMDFDSIYVDESRGIRDGICYLNSRNYRKIGFIGEAMTQGRLVAFQKAMEEQGLALREEWIQTGTLRAEMGGYTAMKNLLKQDSLPDAVFASYDQMAIGALKAMDEAGISVPKDMAIMGFDNIVLSEYVHGGLTTIKNPMEDMVSIAVRILMNRTNHDDTAPQQIALKPELVIRSTTE